MNRIKTVTACAIILVSVYHSISHSETVTGTRGQTSLNRNAVWPVRPDEELRQIGKLDSPFESCSNLLLVDFDKFQKNEAAWRSVRSESSQATPLEFGPSACVIKRLDVTSVQKPGLLTPDEFLKRVGATAVSDLKSGLAQYRELRKCLESVSDSKLCGKLEFEFQSAIEINVGPLNRALAKLCGVKPSEISRAIVMNDPTVFLNPEGEPKLAGVFGAAERKIPANDLSIARREIREAFEKAKTDYASGIESKISSDGLSENDVKIARAQMTSPQVTTAAIRNRMAVHQSAKLAEYYRALSNAPQLG